MKVCVLTDSGSILNLDYAKNNNVKVVPLYIGIGENDFKDMIEINNQDIKKHLESGNILRTSQPSPQDFINVYEEILSEGYTDVVSIHLSSILSGTFSNAKSVADMYSDKLNIRMIDSLSGDVVLRSYVEYLVDGLSKGIDVDVLVSDINYFIKKQSIYVMPSSLEQLQRSGRASKSQLFFTNALSLKLIFDFSGGSLELCDKIRGEKKAFNKLDSYIDDAINKGVKKIYLMNVFNDSVYPWKERLSLKYPDITFEITELTSLVSVHAGIGTVCVGYDGNY